MNRTEQRKQAASLLSYHHAPELLILPNAWDAVSARIYEMEGFKAIGTTSAGIAATLGYPDGEHMTLSDTIGAVQRIVACTQVPISADLEAGYAATPEGTANAAQAALKVGAVGLNIEDGTGNASVPLLDVSLHVEKITAIREMANAHDIPLVINARTDVFLATEGPTAERLSETVARGNAYRQAGADCVFVPDMGGLDRDTIRHLVEDIDAPLNIIAGPATRSLPELQELGVARVSFGPRAMRVALAVVRAIAREWRDTGTYKNMSGETLTYAEVNGMFSPVSP